MAWHRCPACGNQMSTKSDGVESCPDRSCPYHRGGSKCGAFNNPSTIGELTIRFNALMCFQLDPDKQAYVEVERDVP